MPRSDRGGGRGARRRPSAVGRRASVRLKTAKGRKKSSTRWLQRQLNDPYVAEAERSGYRSRAAWKLIQLDDRFGFLARGRRVLDLGAAPGGWTQVAAERVGAGDTGGAGRVVAVDTAEMEPVSGAEILTLDVFEAAVFETDGAAPFAAVVGGAFDVVLSDMAAPATGHRGTDQLRSLALSEAAHALAREVLAAGGTLVLKAFHGGGDAALMAALKRDFARVRTAKPPASRAESAEVYIVANGFRGAAGGRK